MDYDVLIVGAGIGGMESALSLGDMGFRVVLVEKQPSVGGKMILLSKVFPTLDCASCISTPKMAATQAHPNVTTHVFTEVDRVSTRSGGGFEVQLRHKPTFVDFAKCTGCNLCQDACTVAVPDEFNADLAARHAAYIAFPQAVPKRAVISRNGLSPCSYQCPAGVKPHGYISLVRAGRYEEAFRQHLEDSPFVGVLSRACYATCEDICARRDLEGPVSIRGIKRFMSDRYYAQHPEPEPVRLPSPSGQRVAVVGSGPAGLTAAYFLARAGHAVSIFEAEPEVGGMLRWGIPAYRLPKEVVDRDVKNITALGVDIRTGTRVVSLDDLKARGFSAVFLAVGTRGGRRLGVPGDDATGVYDSLEFLRGVNAGTPARLDGKVVAVVGGGNVAIDCARSAVRLGAREVHLVYRRTRDEMPAHASEVHDAESDGVRLWFSWSPNHVTVREGKVTALELVGTASAGGRGRTQQLIRDESRHQSLSVDVIVSAIGLSPATDPFAAGLATAPNGTLRVSNDSLQTSVPFVFAGGDDVLGPSSIAEACGQGRRAAFHIDRWLRGQSLTDARFDDRLPVTDRTAVVREARATASRRSPSPVRTVADLHRQSSFAEYELAPTEEEARYGANRCLDCGICSECRECVAACPADAIDLHMLPRQETVSVGAVALATGFELSDLRRKPLLGFGRFPNVISGLQADRILAPTRPFNAVVRPSDGKAPGNVGIVLCAGSRDESVNNRACSRVCCMYSLKHAQLLMGALPTADITIYYTDIRSYGKGYEEFYQQSKGMGVRFVRGKVARIEETEGQDLLVHYEEMEGQGGAVTGRHDLVILAAGLLPAQFSPDLFAEGPLERDSLSYVREPDEELDPGRTSLEGVFAIGAATAVRDIPDTVLHSGAVAAEIAGYLKRRGLA